MHTGELESQGVVMQRSSGTNEKAETRAGVSSRFLNFRCSWIGVVVSIAHWSFGVFPLQ